MNDTRFPWGILSLVVGLGVMIALVLLMLRRDASATTPPVAPVTGEVRAPPPNAAHDPRATAAYVRSESCRADCTSADRVCRGSAVEVEQEARCAETLHSCETACR